MTQRHPCWMIEYAGVLHTLYSQELHEGLTPFQRMKGRKRQIALETFLLSAQHPIQAGVKMAIWSVSGYTTPRHRKDYRRKSRDLCDPNYQAEARWTPDLVKAVCGLPWKTSPRSPGMELDCQNRWQLEHLSAKGCRRQSAPFRRLYIRQTDLDSFGHTAGCEACAAIREGRSRAGINHTEHCRKRITEAMKETQQEKPDWNEKFNEKLKSLTR